MFKNQYFHPSCSTKQNGIPHFRHIDGKRLLPYRFAEVQRCKYSGFLLNLQTVPLRACNFFRDGNRRKTSPNQNLIETGKFEIAVIFCISENCIIFVLSITKKSRHEEEKSKSPSSKPS
jgi:hypothetical protein